MQDLSLHPSVVTYNITAGCQKREREKKKQTFCAYTCDAPGMCASRWYYIKALVNEDTLLPTQMFPRLPARATFVADTNFVSGHKNVSDFVQKHFVSATNVSQFAQPKKHHEQQCVLVCQYLKSCWRDQTYQYNALLYGCVSQRLETTESTNLIG